MGDTCHTPAAGMHQGCQTLFTAPATSPPVPLPPPMPPGPRHKPPSLARATWGTGGLSFCQVALPSALSRVQHRWTSSVSPAPFGLRGPLQDQARGALGSPEAKVQGHQALLPRSPTAPALAPSPSHFRAAHPQEPVWPAGWGYWAPPRVAGPHLCPPARARERAALIGSAASRPHLSRPCPTLPRSPHTLGSPDFRPWLPQVPRGHRCLLASVTQNPPLPLRSCGSPLGSVPELDFQRRLAQ